MNKPISLLLFVSFKCLFAGQGHLDSLILFGIDQSIRQNYATAEPIFTKILNDNPNHPQGYFFLAAAIQSKSMDFETDKWEDKFLLNLDKTEDTAKKLLREKPNDAWAHFYFGSALSYRAFYDGKKKKYLSALKKGFAGIAELNKAVKLDSTLYDAYMGIGSYKYWRSKITRYFNWLPLIHDEREQGIRLVKLAANKGVFTKYASINSLVWILIDHGKVSEALEWANLGLARYPESRFFLWGVAKCYFNLQQYHDAIHYYDLILASVRTETLNNHYNEIICLYKLADCHFLLKEYSSAKKYCDTIEKLRVRPDIKNRLDEILKKVSELNREINALLN